VWKRHGDEVPSIRRTYDTHWTGDDWEETLLDEWTAPRP
jgi:hypothetical protein